MVNLTRPRLREFVYHIQSQWVNYFPRMALIFYACVQTQNKFSYSIESRLAIHLNRGMQISPHSVMVKTHTEFMIEA